MCSSHGLEFVKKLKWGDLCNDPFYDSIPSPMPSPMPSTTNDFDARMQLNSIDQVKCCLCSNDMRCPTRYNGTNYKCPCCLDSQRTLKQQRKIKCVLCSKFFEMKTSYNGQNPKCKTCIKKPTHFIVGLID